MNQNVAKAAYHNKRAEAYQKSLFVLEEELKEYESHMASLRSQGKRVDAFREGRKRRHLMAKIDSVRYFIEAEKTLADFSEKDESDA